MGARTTFNLDKLLYNADGGGENVFSFISAFFAFFRVKFALFASFLDKLPPFPTFQFIGGSNTDARLFANGVIFSLVY